MDLQGAYRELMSRPVLSAVDGHNVINLVNVIRSAT